MNAKFLLSGLILFFSFSLLISQSDSTKKKIQITTKDPLRDSSIIFSGTRITHNEIYDESTGAKIHLSGYVSTYFASYSDSVGVNEFQKFPTSAPRSNQFGLNIAQFSVKYNSNLFRGMFCFHFGDIPQSSWAQPYNSIQEANIGVKLSNKLWFDAGYFRSHIGLESIQPRENIAISMATISSLEPYFFSGAKLTYLFSPKLTLQLNAFNSFNSFVETNKNKVIGFSALYEPGNKLSFTFNTLICDESPDNSIIKHKRIYNNLYGVFRLKKMTIGTEVNFGAQQNSLITNENSTAYVYSALLEAKYNCRGKFYVYAREEFFHDKNGILSGLFYNDENQLEGLNIIGETIGVEYKPLVNSYIRLEDRLLNTFNHEKYFIFNHQASNLRNEILLSFGIWF